MPFGRTYAGALLSLLLTFAPAAWGHSNPPSNDDFDFGDDEEVGIEPSDSSSSPWALTGFLRSDWGLWVERFEDNPFAKGRQSLDLKLTFKSNWFRLLFAGHGEYDVAYQHKRDSYDDATLDAYEWDIRDRELLIAFSPGDFEITLGRQIVAWGEGDALSPLDVVNPRDMREPGLSDLDDLRLSVLATRLGWFAGDHRVEAMVIHESDFGLRTPPFGPFSPLPALTDSAAALLVNKQLRFTHNQSRFALDQQQYLMRWVYKGAGIDLGLYGAYIQDRTGVLVAPPADQLIAIVFSGKTDLAIPLDHPMYWMTGTSGAWAWESLLIKWELGAEFNRSFNVGDLSDPSGIGQLAAAKRHVINTMIGMTWNGVSDLLITFEASKPWILNRPNDMVAGFDRTTLGVRVGYTLLNERLQLNVAATTIGLETDLDLVIRAEAQYELMDGFKVALGYVHFRPGSNIDNPGLLFGLENHDRLFGKLRWDFTIL